MALPLAPFFRTIVNGKSCFGAIIQCVPRNSKNYLDLMTSRRSFLKSYSTKHQISSILESCKLPDEARPTAMKTEAHSNRATALKKEVLPSPTTANKSSSQSSNYDSWLTDCQEATLESTELNSGLVHEPSFPGDYELNASQNVNYSRICEVPSHYRHLCEFLKTCHDEGKRYPFLRRIVFLPTGAVQHKDHEGFMKVLDLWWIQMEDQLRRPDYIRIIELKLLIYAISQLNATTNGAFLRQLGWPAFMLILETTFQHRNITNMMPWLFHYLLNYVYVIFKQERQRHSGNYATDNMAQLQALLQKTFVKFLKCRSYEPMTFMNDSLENNLFDYFAKILAFLRMMKVRMPNAQFKADLAHLSFICHNLVNDDRLWNKKSGWPMLFNLYTFSVIFDFWHFEPEEYGYQYWQNHFALMRNHLATENWDIKQDFLWRCLFISLKTAVKFHKITPFDIMRSSWLKYFDQAKPYANQYDVSELVAVCVKRNFRDQAILNCLSGLSSDALVSLREFTTKND